MRGDKFTAKRSRAYRSSRAAGAPALPHGELVMGLSVELRGCVRVFMDQAGLTNEAESVLLLLMAGLGLALSGPNAFEAAVSAFQAPHTPK